MNATIIDPKDRLPVWQLVKVLDVNKREVMALLREWGFPVGFNDSTGDVYTSRSLFRAYVTGGAR